MVRWLRFWCIALAITALPAAGAVAQEHRTILIVGDSLSAEYGLPRDTGWVSLLSQRLASGGAMRTAGPHAAAPTTSSAASPSAPASSTAASSKQTRAGPRQYSVANASISGETTSGGRTRLPALLAQHQPAIVVLQLGANDGLRGLPLAAMRENLRAMIQASRAAGAQVILVGMRLPPNFGRDYAERFFDTFAELAREEKTAYVPFLLDGFAEDLAWFQPDRIHPNVKAQQRMLDNMWPALRPLVGA